MNSCTDGDLRQLGAERAAEADAHGEEAQSAHKTGRYDVSYEKFCFILAIIEMDPHRSGPDEMSAMITSNIASALHFLGEVSPHLARARTHATQEDDLS